MLAIIICGRTARGGHFRYRVCCRGSLGRGAGWGTTGAAHSAPSAPARAPPQPPAPVYPHRQLPAADRAGGAHARGTLARAVAVAPHARGALKRASPGPRGGDGEQCCFRSVLTRATTAPRVPARAVCRARRQRCWRPQACGRRRRRLWTPPRGGGGRALPRAPSGGGTPRCSLRAHGSTWRPSNLPVQARAPPDPERLRRTQLAVLRVVVAAGLTSVRARPTQSCT